MPYVYSTLTCDNEYTSWVDAGSRKIVQKSVLIKGGNGVVDKSTLITPVGVVTEVSEAELEFLKTIPAFQEHEKNGFITFEVGKRQEPEKMAAKMKRHDKSAPKTESDFNDVVITK